MKTETQIAKEKLKKIEDTKKKFSISMGNQKDMNFDDWLYEFGDSEDCVEYFSLKAEAKQQKKDSQRFLEFLEKIYDEFKFVYKSGNTLLDDKITDLKQAIKLYEDAGI